MPDQAVINFNENTPEQVAYRLMRDVLVVEKSKMEDVDRQGLLDTYAECLEVVSGKRARRK